MLHDCISKDDAELFLIGPSAGPCLREHRDRLSQAYLILEDEVFQLNLEVLDECLDSEGFKSIVASLGVGVDLGFASTIVPEKRRYSRIILALETEAQVDFMVRLFERYFGPILLEGHVYRTVCVAGLDEAGFLTHVISPESRVLTQLGQFQTR